MTMIAIATNSQNTINDSDVLKTERTQRCDFLGVVGGVTPPPETFLKVFSVAFVFSSSSW